MPGRVPALVDALVFARGYTVSLLDSIPESDWFLMPVGCPSHVAWQVGHLAMAEARLIVERVGGRRIVEEGVLPAQYLKLFGRESIPDPDPGKHPSPGEIRGVFDRVHPLALQILKETRDDDLETLVVGTPHRFCRTKLDYAGWVSAHEMLHAGQIGLLRRLLGQKAVW